jgi:hypothetical protein
VTDGPQDCIGANSPDSFSVDGLLGKVLALDEPSCLSTPKAQANRAEGQFDWVEVGRVLWQVEKRRARGLDGFTHPGGKMGFEMVDDDDISRSPRTVPPPRAATRQPRRTPPTGSAGPRNSASTSIASKKRINVKRVAHP